MFQLRTANKAQATIPVALVALAVAAATATAQCGGGGLPATQTRGASDKTQAQDPGRPAVSHEWHPTRQVIVVAIDGVRWQEVFLGSDRDLIDDQAVPDELILPPERLLPNLYGRVVPRGIVVGAPGHGPPMLASGPNFVSLPGYMEMLSGAPVPYCTDNNCDHVRSPTLVDDFRSHVSAQSEVGVLASWDPIERAAALDAKGVTISTGRHGGVTRDRLRDDRVAAELLDLGAAAPAFPGRADYRPDSVTAPLALRFLTARRPSFLFVGLGDTDEYGHRDDYQSYLQALRFADGFVGDLLRTLDTMGEYGSTTTVVITTDHGREASFRGHGRNHPESARVWMMAVGGAVPSRGMLTSEREHHLADIAVTLRVLAGFSEPTENDAVIAGMLPESPARRSELVARSARPATLQ